MKLKLITPPKQELILPKLIVPHRLRGDRSRISRLPAPWVRRWTRETMGAVYSAGGTLAGGTSSTPTNVTPTIPACVAGNMLIMPVVGSTSGGTNHVTNFTVPAGWTKLGDGGLAIRFTAAVLWKISDGTEGGTTPTTGISFSATNGFTIAKAYCFTGNDPNAAPETAVILTGTTATGTVATPFVTGANDDLVVCVTVSEALNATYGLISGSTATWVQRDTDGTSGQAESMNIQTTAVPAAGTTVSGGSTTISGATNWTSFVFAIQPDPGKNGVHMVNQAVNRASRW